MKVSEIQQSDILQHLRIYDENLDPIERKMLDSMKAAAINYVKEQTGLSILQLDEHEDLTIVVLVIVSDLWNNRELTINKTSENKLIENMLYMYSKNLLPSKV
ncbi:MAG: head-tail connector protein [Erysipelotrichaceae bacterium]